MRRLLLVGALALVLAGAPHVLPADASHVQWASAATAAIRPGVQTVTAGSQCTANFVLTAGTDVFLGQAAHCSGQGAPNETDGCDQSEDPLPIGTPVGIRGFDGRNYTGTLAYSSWNTMLGNGEKDANTCQFNDFALVRIHPDDHDAVNPSLPRWGGPQGVRTAPTSFGETVYTYGNSGLRGGVSALSPKTGSSLGTMNEGWNHQVYTATPGVPGDSGSPVLDRTGLGVGVLVTVAVAPFPGSNGVSDLSKLLAYAKAHGTDLSTLTLVNGTEAFSSSGSAA